MYNMSFLHKTQLMLQTPTHHVDNMRTYLIPGRWEQTWWTLPAGYNISGFQFGETGCSCDQVDLGPRCQGGAERASLLK